MASRVQTSHFPEPHESGGWLPTVAQDCKAKHRNACVRSLEEETGFKV